MHRLLACCSLCALLGCAALPAGFQPIFNEEDLSGFRVVGPALWTVENGAIAGRQDPNNPGAGFLVTNYTWRDFELLLEFKVVPQYGRSVVVVRDVKAGAGDPLKDGCAVQILDREDAPFRTGSILGLTPSLAGAQRSGWNAMRILAFGEWLRVDLNGAKVAEAKVGNDREGTIDLYCTGGRAELQTRAYFRGLAVRPLYDTPAEFADKIPAPDMEEPEDEEPKEPEKTPEQLFMEELSALMDSKLAPIAAKLNEPAPAPETVFGPIIDKKLAEFEQKIAPALAKAGELPPPPDAALDAIITKKLAEFEQKIAPVLAKAAEPPPSPDAALDAIVTKKLAEFELKIAPALAKAAEPPPSPDAALDTIVAKRLAEFEQKIAPALAKAAEPPPPPDAALDAIVAKRLAELEQKILPVLAKLAEPRPAPETVIEPLIDKKLDAFFTQKIAPLLAKLPAEVAAQVYEKMTTPRRKL